MSWTPDPNEPSANFEEPVIDNALRIITRDFKQALDYYYPAEKLLDFAERALGQVLGNEFPCLALGVRGNRIEEADDRSHLLEVVTLELYIGVTADGPGAVTRRIMRYVKVVDLVLRNSRREFFTGMNNPFGVVLAIEHEYGPIGKKESIYFRSAILTVTVNLRER